MAAKVRNISEKIFSSGYAIGGIDITTGRHHFRYRSEDFVLKTMCLSKGPPNRIVPTQYARELGLAKYGIVAKIEDVRACAEFEKNR